MSLTQTLVTFGVDSTLLESYFPQLGLGSSSDLFTSTHTTNAINHAAARVCGVLEHAGLNPGDVNSASTSTIYYQAQRLVCLTAVCQIALGISGLGVGAETAIQDMRDEIRQTIADLQTTPEALDSTASPKARTTTESRTLTYDCDNLPVRSWQTGYGHKVHW